VSGLRVAAHQPNLFPWLGFFDKMRASDVFVLLDAVPFNRRGYQHRVRIGTPSGVRWLTLPVLKKGRYGEPTDEVRIDDSRPWRHDHLETLRHAYGKAPAFADRIASIEGLYEAASYQRLIDFTLPGIDLLRSHLGLDTEMRRASELVAPGLSSSELLAAAVVAAGGDTYVSGPTGRSYMDEDVFASRGVRVEYRTFVPFAYEQRCDGFEPGLSALDLVFNVPDARGAWNASEGEG
jgi:hypothetical protein